MTTVWVCVMITLAALAIDASSVRLTRRAAEKALAAERES